MLPIPEVTDVDLVFPTKTPLPLAEEIPREFWRSSHPMAEVASSLFFRGGKLAEYGLRPKPGVDQAKALRALRVCLGSWEPTHEHKEAGVAFLLNEWFEKGRAA